MTKDEFDDREDLYEHLLKEVTALCECGSSADIIVHALIRNAVELAVVCTENTAEARATLAEGNALVAAAMLDPPPVLQAVTQLVS
jgi:hypothetical protein